eukprot:g5896.t1
MSRKYGEELDEDDYLDTRRQTAFTKLGKKVVSSRSREWNHGSDSDDEDSREHILPSMNRRRDDEEDEGKVSHRDEGKVAEGKVSERVPPPKKGVPPPRGAPPRGARPSGAVSMVRKQLQSGMAPPSSPPPKSANLNARAMFRAKMAKNSAAGGRKVPPPKGKPAVSRFARQAAIEIGGDMGASGEGGGDIYKQIRKEVVNKDTREGDNSNSDDDGDAHPLFGVGDRVKDVFSHEWEVQTPKGGSTSASAKGRSTRRGAGDGGRYEQPKNRSIRRGKGRKTDTHGDVLGGGDSDDDDDRERGGGGRNKVPSNIMRAGPTTKKLGAGRDGDGRRDDRDDVGSGDDRDKFESDFYGEVADMEGEKLKDDGEDAAGRRRRERQMELDKEEAEFERRKAERRRQREMEEAMEEAEEEERRRRRQQEREAKANVDGEADDLEYEGEGVHPRDTSSSKSNAEDWDAAGSPKSLISEDDSSVGDSIMRYYNPANVPQGRDELIQWLLNPPTGGEDRFVRCYIERDRSGIKKKLNPVYRLYLEQGPETPPRLLMVAQKKSMTAKTNVLISLDEKDLNKSHSKRGSGYLGKLQSSHGETEYTLYDRGLNPVDVLNASHKEFFGKNMSRESVVRKEMGVMLFQRSKQTEADRRMEVCIPSIIATADGTEHTVEWRPITNEDTMRSWFKRIIIKGAQNIMCRERMMCMHNRTWSSGRTSNLIDFMGRANETSVKNFQLVVSPPQDRYLKAKYDQSPLGTIDTDDVSNVLVQMGRDADRFNVDFQYPVPAFTAFAICLCRFVTKQSDE